METPDFLSFEKIPREAWEDTPESVKRLVQELLAQVGQHSFQVQSENRLVQFLDALPVGVAVHDAAGELIYINQTGQEILGIEHLVKTAPEQLAETFRVYSATTKELYPAPHLPSNLALLGQRVRADDLEIHRPDRTIPLEVWATPIFDPQGQIVDAIVLFQDISDRKQHEAALHKSEIRYRQVVETQTDFILRSLPETTITFANEALCRVLGHPQTEVLGRKWSDFANPDDLEQIFQRLATLTPDHSSFLSENRDRRANGESGWTQWLHQGIFDAQGQLIEIQSTGRDITELKQAEVALRESETRYRLLAENMTDLVCLHQPDGYYLYVSPSCETLLGYHPEELLGQDPYDFFHPDDRERIYQESHLVALTGKTVPITYRMRQKSGSYIWLETLTKALTDNTGQVTGLQTTSRDITERIQVQKRLRHEALHDALTGLPNRHLLMERLELAINRAKRFESYHFAVLFLDLDRFKVINDSLGHLAGDQLLIAVAQKLRSLLRETDLVARLGGDEFVILLEDIYGVKNAVQVAERILATLGLPLRLAERDLFITTSLGIVLGTPNYTQAAHLLRDADTAMYRAKVRGKARYEIFDTEMHTQALTRLHLETDLRQALEREEFVVYFQPIITIKTGRITGFEALVRWQHPTQGLIAPGQFISVAEEIGLIRSLDRWVLQVACQQLMQWQSQFSDCHSLKISVNLSTQDLWQSGLVEEIDSILAQTGLTGNQLMLELTESMLVENIETTIELLTQLKHRGVQVGIDDFGTGYSSLNYLHSLPVDALKIDRTFVSQMQESQRNQKIVETIVALSHQLGLAAIAEGIETQQQLEKLHQLGCELGQGYLFARPLLPNLAATWLGQQSVFETGTTKS